MIHFVFSSATVINRPEVHPKAAFWPRHFIVDVSIVFCFFFGALSLAVII